MDAILGVQFNFMSRFLPLCLLFMATVVAAQNKPRPFTVTGRVRGTDTALAKLYLQYRTQEGWKLDSTEIKDKQFSFQSMIAEPTLASLQAKNKSTGVKSMVAAIFLERGQIRIELPADLKSIKVRNSASHNAYRQLVAQSKPFDTELDTLYKQYSLYGRSKEKAKQAAVEARIDSIDELKKEKVYHRFLVENPNTPLSAYVLEQYAGWEIDPHAVEPLYYKLTQEEQAYPSMMALRENIQMAKLTQIGAPAMEFVQNDTLDKPVALSSFRGKYLLIDFWASWCGPCRAENPNVVKAFQQYQSKNFHILGVSLDRPGQKDKWMKAIHDDGLTWTQVSDLKFWNNAVAVQYGIRAIPQNLLIDPNGIIIGKNLRGEKLMSELEKSVK